MIGVSTRGRSSFATTRVTGRKRVPLPATGITAVLIFIGFLFPTIAWYDNGSGALQTGGKCLANYATHFKTFFIQRLLSLSLYFAWLRCGRFPRRARHGGRQSFWRSAGSDFRQPRLRYRDR